MHRRRKNRAPTGDASNDAPHANGSLCHAIIDLAPPAATGVIDIAGQSDAKLRIAARRASYW
jgi:hypothetical protein